MERRLIPKENEKLRLVQNMITDMITGTLTGTLTADNLKAVNIIPSSQLSFKKPTESIPIDSQSTKEESPKEPTESIPIDSQLTKEESPKEPTESIPIESHIKQKSLEELQKSESTKEESFNKITTAEMKSNKQKQVTLMSIDSQSTKEESFKKPTESMPTGSQPIKQKLLKKLKNTLKSESVFEINLEETLMKVPSLTKEDLEKLKTYENISTITSNLYYLFEPTKQDLFRPTEQDLIKIMSQSLIDLNAFIPKIQDNKTEKSSLSTNILKQFKLLDLSDFNISELLDYQKILELQTADLKTELLTLHNENKRIYEFHQEVMIAAFMEYKNKTPIHNTTQINWNSNEVGAITNHVMQNIEEYPNLLQNNKCHKANMIFSEELIVIAFYNNLKKDIDTLTDFKNNISNSNTKNQKKSKISNINNINDIIIYYEIILKLTKWYLAQKWSQTSNKTNKNDLFNTILLDNIEKKDNNRSILFENYNLSNNSQIMKIINHLYNINKYNKLLEIIAIKNTALILDNNKMLKMSNQSNKHMVIYDIYDNWMLHQKNNCLIDFNSCIQQKKDIIDIIDTKKRKTNKY